MLIPDLAGWQRERMPVMPAEPWFSVRPDWVCEVLSSATERIDRTRKLRIYAEVGVPHTWLVNPIARTLEVLELRDGAWTILAIWENADIVRIPPFETLELHIGRLWAETADRELGASEGSSDTP